MQKEMDLQKEVVERLTRECEQLRDEKQKLMESISHFEKELLREKESFAQMVHNKSSENSDLLSRIDKLEATVSSERQTNSKMRFVIEKLRRETLQTGDDLRAKDLAVFRSMQKCVAFMAADVASKKHTRDLAAQCEALKNSLVAHNAEVLCANERTKEEKAKFESANCALTESKEKLKDAEARFLQLKSATSAKSLNLKRG